MSCAEDVRVGRIVAWVFEVVLFLLQVLGNLLWQALDIAFHLPASAEEHHVLAFGHLKLLQHLADLAGCEVSDCCKGS